MEKKAPIDLERHEIPPNAMVATMAPITDSNGNPCLVESYGGILVDKISGQPYDEMRHGRFTEGNDRDHITFTDDFNLKSD